MTSPVLPPDDLLRFIEKRVVPNNNPNKQTELLDRFREKLTRALNCYLPATDKWSVLKRRYGVSRADINGTFKTSRDESRVNLGSQAQEGHCLVLQVRRMLLGIQPPGRRVHYNDVVWELTKEFNLQWKRFKYGEKRWAVIETAQSAEQERKRQALKADRQEWERTHRVGYLRDKNK